MRGRQLMGAPSGRRVDTGPRLHPSVSIPPAETPSHIPQNQSAAGAGPAAGKHGWHFQLLFF